MCYPVNISQDFYQTRNDSGIWGITLEIDVGEFGEKEKVQEGKGQTHSV